MPIARTEIFNGYVKKTKRDCRVISNIKCLGSITMHLLVTKSLNFLELIRIFKNFQLLYKIRFTYNIKLQVIFNVTKYSQWDRGQRKITQLMIHAN